VVFIDPAGADDRGADLLASKTAAGEVLRARRAGERRAVRRTRTETLDGGEGDDQPYPDDNPYSMSAPPLGPDTVAGAPGNDQSLSHAVPRRTPRRSTPPTGPRAIGTTRARQCNAGASRRASCGSAR
jgi:hypothetical protein